MQNYAHCTTCIRYTPVDKQMQNISGGCISVAQTSLQNYKINIKNKMLNHYNAVCTIRDFYACQ